MWLSACGPSSTNCAADELLCGSRCADPQTDSDHCGSCNNPCGDGEICVESACVVGERCAPDATEPCYSGPADTEDVGPCHGGTHTCRPDGNGWEPCVGEVTPVTEVCSNGEDDDCNGAVDDDLDNDGDGWTACEGDCCDILSHCSEPALVNPGAFEVDGNGLDDDCDGTADNVLADCDSGLASNSGDPLDYARAMDLCQTTTEGGNEWGVISGAFSLASGSGTASADSRAIRPAFGGTAVQRGASFVVLSSGHAAAVGDTNPSYAAPQESADTGTSSAVPSDWLTANGGNMPNAPGCPEPENQTANNPVMLKLRIRVPTNAKSFSLSSRFFSSEYPEWVCSAFNDFFVVLLDSSWSGNPTNPADKNLAIYTAPGDVDYPVGVNLAFGDTGLFTICKNGETGCGQSAVPGSTSTCDETALGELSNTGYDIANPAPSSQFPSEPGYCGSNNLSGGATGWLTTSGNVTSGEIIELRFAIWDTGDQWYDSAVLLDNFQWSVESSDPGTIIE